MLREFQRVLKPGGRVVGYVIHTPDKLSVENETRARELGPSKVTAPGSPEELADLAGLSVIDRRDVTNEYHSTCEALLRAREELEIVLRAEEGDKVYEEGQSDKVSRLKGIDEGLLQRSLIVALK